MAVRGLVAAVERAGVEREAFLAQVGLQAHALDDVQVRIPLATYRGVVRAAIASTRDPALGLHLAERAAMGTFDVLGYLGEHCSNLRDAFQTIARYTRIVTDGPQLVLTET